MEEHPRVLIAPDKFKGTLDAEEAAGAMAAGIRAACPRAHISTLPVADGGEGTIEALLSAGGSAHDARVQGPLSEPRSARFVTLGRTAFIESAQACGLQLIQPDEGTAMAAHSFGVGELIRAALDLGCAEIIVGLGGVACTDGGTGMLMALGAKFLDHDAAPLPLGGGGLNHLARVQISDLDPRLSRTRLVAACDVTNPLTGPRGAAAVFGPQKGAGPAQVAQLDTALDRLTRVVRTDEGVDIDEIAGGGAAGGIAAGMVGLLDAEIASGSDLILGMLGLTQQVPEVDVVLTGEGKLDRQSLYGKAPVSVARIAREHAVPTIALAGVTEAAARDELAEVFVLTGSMVEHAGTEQALGEPVAVLRDLTQSIFHDWLHRWERP